MFESLNPLYFYSFEEENNPTDFKKNLFDIKEATIYGNIFKNEYIPYKNYVPRIRQFKNHEEKLLMEISYYSNACHDLQLYLDVYPDNKEYSELFEKYSKKEKELEDEYVSKYGPLTASEGKYIDGYFNFVTKPSAWLKGE